MVDHVRGVWQVSIRRACQAVPVDRSTYHYRSKRTGQAPLMKRIKEIAETRVRYGKSPGHAERFTALHGTVHSPCNRQRHLISRRKLRLCRSAAMQTGAAGPAGSMQPIIAFHRARQWNLTIPICNPAIRICGHSTSGR